jgi:hypothetical protein
MKDTIFFKSLENDKQALAQMSFREKVDHLWTYYKGFLWVLVAAAMLITLVCTGIINRNKNYVSSGVTVNVELSQDAIDYLSALCQERHPDLKEGAFSLESSMMEDFEDTQDYEYNYGILSGILTMAAAKDLDYMIMDKVSMELILKQGTFMDLTEIFTQDELTAFGDIVISAREEEETEARPVVINITDLPFIKDNTDADGPVYIAFAASSPRKDACRQIWDDIVAWPQK